MSYPAAAGAGGLRPSSNLSNNASIPHQQQSSSSSGLSSQQQQQQQSAALAARIQSKKAELEDLRHLRDLSGALAGQMQRLEEKLGTLKDGTEAVACVLANWDHVLKAISLASVKAAKVAEQKAAPSEEEKKEGEEAKLPATLIRIPVQEKESVERVIQAQETDEVVKSTE